MWTVNLLDDTISLLKTVRGPDPKRSVRSIASPPDVPYEWLKRFVREVESDGGLIHDPVVGRLQSLHARLLTLKTGANSSRKRAIRRRGSEHRSGEAT